jgi:hypothetical protein
LIRSEGDLLFRHQGREAALGLEDARHYHATVGLRVDSFDIKQMQDEVVLATVGRDIVLSHPQSEMWLEGVHVSEMLRASEECAGVELGQTCDALPDWLNISADSGRLLVSDQRNARWVLLGPDHLGDLRRRLDFVGTAARQAKRLAPPIIPIKGVSIHLQSAFKLAGALEAFASQGDVVGFEEVTPAYRLAVSRAVDGLELKDFERRVAITAREARKWVDIIRGELARLNAAEYERGAIRTVFADGDGGRWVLQWGDEVFVEAESLARIRSGSRDETAAGLRIRQDDRLFVLLSGPTGACVALTESEITSF